MGELRGRNLALCCDPTCRYPKGILGQTKTTSVNPAVQKMIEEVHLLKICKSAAGDKDNRENIISEENIAPSSFWRRTICR